MLLQSNITGSGNATHGDERGLYTASQSPLRRFEFHCRLTGARALILHFKSVTSSGEAVLDAKGREILHVVEVSEDSVSPLLLRGIAVAGLVGAAALVLRR